MTFPFLIYKLISAKIASLFSWVIVFDNSTEQSLIYSIKWAMFNLTLPFVLLIFFTVFYIYDSFFSYFFLSFFFFQFQQLIGLADFYKWGWCFYHWTSCTISFLLFILDSVFTYYHSLLWLWKVATSQTCICYRSNSVKEIFSTQLCPFWLELIRRKRRITKDKWRQRNLGWSNRLVFKFTYRRVGETLGETTVQPGIFILIHTLSPLEASQIPSDFNVGGTWQNQTVKENSEFFQWGYWVQRKHYNQTGLWDLNYTYI